MPQTPEDRKAYQKSYRKAHREQLNAYARDWRKKNKGYHRTPAQSVRRKKYETSAAGRAAQKRKYVKRRDKESHAEREVRLKRTSEQRLRSLYGIGFDEYESLLALQRGKCGICGSEKPGRRTKRFFVDHCHETTRVRGLLCYHCNTGLGNFRDDPQVLQMAIKYLVAYATR